MPPMMGSEYGRPGNTWAPDADERYNREHAIDPNTGGISGPAGAVPAGVALNWQMAHNQAVYDLRQRWMQGGIQAQQSALGQLQSFRPGGLASLESGVYERLAGYQFQRAAMTEPMNVMPDYVRDAEARARQKANRAGEFRQIAGAVLGAAAIAAPIVGGALAGGGAAGGIADGGMAAGFGGGAGGQAMGAGAQMAAGAAGAMLGGQTGQQGQQGSATQLGQIGQQAVGGQMPQPMPAQGAQGGGQQAGGMMAGMPSAPGGIIGLPTPPGGAPGLPRVSSSQSGQAQMGGGGAGGPQGGAGSTPAGGGGGAGGGAGPSPMSGAGGQPRVGSAGDFSPLAFSVAAAGNPSPGVDAVQTMIMDRLADLIENDPDWHFMDMLWSQQLEARATYGVVRSAGYGEETSARWAAQDSRDHQRGRSYGSYQSDTVRR